MKSLIFLACAAASACTQQQDSETKIIGGRAPTQNYGFFVGLYGEGYSGSSFCGGSLIETDVVLTAAHCVEGAGQVMNVAIGIQNNNITDPTQLRRVQAVSVHPDYRGPEQGNDIALLFLEPGAGDEIPITTIALNDRSDRPAIDSSVRVIGNGNTTSVGSRFSANLRETDVSVISSATCSTMGGSYGSVNDTMLCAGSLYDGGSDSCQGDSGGPLFSSGPQPQLVGIVSYGDSCGQRKKPGVYTRVSSFVPWIRDAIQDHRNPPAVLDASTIPSTLRKYCYYSASDYKPSDEKLAYFDYQASIHLNYDFTELADGIDPIAERQKYDSVSLCGFTMPTGIQVELHYLKTKESDLAKVNYPLLLKINDQWYQGTSRSDKTTSFHCRKSESDSNYLSFTYDFQYNSVYYTSLYENGYGSSLDQPEYGYGNAVERPTGLLREQLRCKSGNGDLRIVTAKDRVYASVRNMANVEPQWFVIQKSPSWETSAGLHTKLVPMGTHKAIMEIINDTGDDLYTWDLSCPFRFSLKDRNQTTYQAAGTAARSSVSFEYPTDRNGSIPAGLSRTFTLEVQGATVDDILGQTCSINGWNQAFEYELP